MGDTAIYILAIAALVIISYLSLVLQARRQMKSKATHIVKARPGPETCAKDVEDPFANSHLTLETSICADGICCFTALSSYTPSAGDGLEIKVFVRGKGLDVSYDPCKHLIVHAMLNDCALLLEFRCGCYASRPDYCHQYPEQTMDGNSVCTYNEYLAPYHAYPFGHWVLHYGFPDDETVIQRMFPNLDPSKVLEVLRTDPYLSTQSVSGRDFILVPVPKNDTVLYRSYKHPALETFSQAMAIWPESMRLKYRKTYGSLAEQVLVLDQEQAQKREAAD